MPIFRLQRNDTNPGLANTIQHWGVSNLYDDRQINAIQSSNPNSLTEPTSIPSPFARIALVKIAFSEVAQYGNNALVSYQKIVSDSLDVAEIFFNYNKWRNAINIIEWNPGLQWGNNNNLTIDPENDLGQLQKKHIQFYKTLNTFLQNDADEFNFNQLRSIFLLRHRDSGSIIGSTSPSTLFCSSPNDYSGLNLTLDNNRNAFSSILPFHKRSWIFQRYIFAWIAVNNQTKMNNNVAVSVFHEFIAYINAEKENIDRTAAIDALDEIDPTLYAPLTVANPVEILGIPIHYTTQIPISSLTANDLFENEIIRIPYSINQNSYFDGNLPINSQDTFLLPIKNIYFNYQTLDNLKQSLQITSAGNVVNVQLTMGGVIHKKSYSQTDGNLIDISFDCALFPNVEFADPNLANYRFGIVYDFDKQNDFQADFILNNQVIDNKNVKTSIRNASHQNNKQLKNYIVERTNFDYIRLRYKNYSGIIVPLLNAVNGNSTYEFAVDFGTSNTHIEYRVNGSNNIKVFDINQTPSDEKQVHWLHGGDEYLYRVFDEEYIPPYTDDEFKFPMRTALSFGENVNWPTAQPFGLASINELYEKRMDYPYNNTITNLKWSDDSDYQKQVSTYIKSLMYLIRNKVILGNGNLANTKITWFYPVSMERQRYENLKDTWTNAYVTYFGGLPQNIKSITESVAPFEYYLKDGDAQSLATIDIGGGTTDIVVASNNQQVDFITSFRFGANVIFGDGYAQNDRIKNGIVNQFFNTIKEELRTSINDDDLFEMFDMMYNEKSSDDIASFLFSLEHNVKIKKHSQDLAKSANLSAKLKNDNSQKVVFIIFYVAIIYHLAKIMKSKELPIPDKIVFSGNGSRVLNFVCAEDPVLSDFTRYIFEQIYEVIGANKPTTTVNRNKPKEATCKGGFDITNNYDFNTILQKIIVLHSNKSDEIFNRFTNELLENNNQYSLINEEYLKKTAEEAKDFLDFAFDSLNFLSRQHGYDLNNRSIEIARNTCYNKLETYTNIGWKHKSRNINEEDIIEETLFFYPLVGVLKDITVAIHDQNKE